MSFLVRPERSTDHERIRFVTEQAFSQSELGHNGEAGLVGRLRNACDDALSLVAELDGQVVGHILFTPASLDGDTDTLAGMGLAPMSVLPEHQRSGVGSALVEAGLTELQSRCPFVIVLGHPEYYPRFGFVPAVEHGIECEFPDVPDELFLIRIFDEEAVARFRGATARYHREFHNVDS